MQSKSSKNTHETQDIEELKDLTEGNISGKPRIIQKKLINVKEGKPGITSLLSQKQIIK